MTAAFPRPASMRGANPIAEQEGLTKREWFAGMALQGYIIASGSPLKIDQAAVAMWAVKLADAVIAEMEERPTRPDQ